MLTLYFVFEIIIYFKSYINFRKVCYKDWCIELFRLSLLRDSLTEANTGVIYKIQLKLNQVTQIEGASCCSQGWKNRVVLKSFLVDLPALEVIDLDSCYLEQLAPTVFQALLFLDELYLSHNSIQILDSNLFSSNKHLKRLILQNNLIAVLSEDLFRGLNKLTTLNLRSNQIRVLPEELFKDQVSLEHLLLGQNKIDSVSPTLFKSLSNLIT